MKMFSNKVIIGFLIILCIPIFFNIQIISASENRIEINAVELNYFDGESLSIYGETVSGIGDYNSDGYEDFIVGGRMWSEWRGKAWIYFGSNTVSSRQADFTIKGEPNKANSGVCLGHTVANIGDINQDGITDFGVGGPGSWGGWDVGKIYFFYGNSSNENFPDNAGEDENFSITSPIKYDWLGETFSSAGDFNGDSYPDILVGAPGSNYKGEDEVYPFKNGLAYLYLGSTNGLPSLPNITLKDDVDNSGFALSLGGTGDINNDGFDDVVVGAFQSDQSQGRVYLYLGTSEVNANPNPDLILTGLTSQAKFGILTKIIKDLNNDGYDELAIRNFIPVDGVLEARVNIYFGKEDTSLISEPNLVLSSGEDEDDFGFSFDYIGDVNNDTYGDFAVGAPGEADNLETPGKVFIFQGSSNPDEIIDEILIGEKNDDKFGYSVGKVDFNGDSVDDLLIGATGHDSYKGRVYVYSPYIEKQEPTSNVTSFFSLSPLFLLVIIQIRKRK